MSTSIQEIVEREERTLRGTKIIADKWPDARLRSFDTYDGHHLSVWVVDNLSYAECDRIELLGKPPATPRLLLFKNIAPGVNVAPRCCLASLDVFIMHAQRNAKLWKKLAALFKEGAPAL